jgi:hypothetical protein
MYGRSLWFDVSRAQRELGWRARWSNVEMIRQSYDAYRARGARTDTGSPHQSAVRQGILALAKRLF